ncbi:MAG: hypothetical protein ACF8OB_13960 [Phycisphaeraceae bacterium JB051]
MLERVVRKNRISIATLAVLGALGVLAGCQSLPYEVDAQRVLPIGRYLVFASNRVAPHEAFDLFALYLGESDPQKAQLIQLTDAPGHELDPCVSTDGHQMLYVARPVLPHATSARQLARDCHSKLIHMDLRNGQQTTLYQTRGILVHPAWSADNKRVAMSLIRAQPGGMIEHRVIWMDLATQQVHDLGLGSYPNWSADNQYLVVSQTNSDNQSQLWRIDLQSQQRTPISRPGPNTATLSPNKKYLAVAIPQGTDGQPTITVYPADSIGQPRDRGIEVSFGTQSNAANVQPIWLSDPLGAAGYTDDTSMLAYTQIVFNPQPGSKSFLSRIIVVSPDGKTSREVVQADAQNMTGGGYMSALWLLR